MPDKKERNGDVVRLTDAAPHCNEVLLGFKNAALEHVKFHDEIYPSLSLRQPLIPEQRPFTAAALIHSSNRAMPAIQVCNASFQQCGEFGSKKAAAILGRLQVSRACMEWSPMLRAAHQQSSQACLVFSNPSPAVAKAMAGTPPETEFTTRLHPLALKSMTVDNPTCPTCSLSQRCVP
jgi:hypothetical protein